MQTLVARFKRSAYTALLCVAGSMPAVAQNNTCGNAIIQLQHYVAQVNTFANSEYYQGIPMRCGGNPNCMGWWLQNLNAWYMQQSGMVNNWYMQLSRQCSRNQPSGGVRVTRPTQNDPGGLDEDAVDEIEVDDEDKSVAIRIPSTPRGYQR